MSTTRESAVSRSSQRRSPCLSESATTAPPRYAQRLGNQTLQQLLRRQLVQAKLTVSDPGDIHEQEADRVADEVMRMPEPTEPHRSGATNETPRIQRMCQDCEGLQRDVASLSDRPGPQTGDAPAVATADVAARAEQSASAGSHHAEALSAAADVVQSTGEPLDTATRAFFEPRFGYDFSDVRVHTDARARLSASALNAHAYTVGAHIVFGGSHGPSEPGSRRLLAHELTHVVQQSGGGERVQRQLAGCQDLLMEKGAVSLVPGRIVHRILGAHFKATVKGATSVAIPGASAGPLRSDAICGGGSKIIDPQIVGGASGAGLPDLARRTLGGILQVAEIKPAVVPCLIDGEEQELRYIDQGNARDPEQTAWRTSLGISVVSPMPPSAYSPPSLHLVLPNMTAELKTAWCAPGLMAYSVKISGEPVVVPVPQPSRDGANRRMRSEAAERGATVAAGAALGIGTAIAGRALWKHFWRVVVTRFAAREAIALALAAADGPLPVGDLIAIGMTLTTIAQILAEWDDIWREADGLA